MCSENNCILKRVKNALGPEIVQLEDMIEISLHIKINDLDAIYQVVKKVLRLATDIIKDPQN